VVVAGVKRKFQSNRSKWGRIFNKRSEKGGARPGATQKRGKSASDADHAIQGKTGRSKTEKGNFTKEA